MREDDEAFGQRPGRDRPSYRRRDYLDVGAARDDRDREDADRDGRPAGRNEGARPSSERRQDEGGKRPSSEGEDSKGEKGAQKDEGGQNDEGEARRKSRRPLVIGIAAVVILAMIGGGVYYWLSTRGKASTDDAYTDGNIVTIAPQVAGQVVSLDVTDNQFVHKGDPLFHIDARQYAFAQEQAQGQLDTTKAQADSQKLGVEIARKNFPAALELAKANLDSAKANLQLQQANYDRQKSLPKLATTQQEVDTTAANLAQAKAQVEQAQARVIQAEPVKQNIGQSEDQLSQIQGQIEQAEGRLDQAKLNVEWTVVRAPQDGWVTRRNVNAGNYISAGQQVMSLVTTDMWVTANFKETQLDGMRPGQKVSIAIDAYPDLDLQGHVDSIQRGSGSKFSAFPAENATGNFIKIVQRVPVKIVIDSGLKKDEPLPLGISAEPTVMLK
ncbi:HlyD family secretion protein [Methylobacterium aerolatum]|uniref:Membrane fusion protein (Multidrug efflux system) n=1 Tax=Methylobacterium aerolatum TaxID=418708 RepID=A0ABU0I1H7_9HYPH|nr:HlyD family secretion protein [Methylobacterium aerolatum]MDQ0448459.1 membrane fusion protein (multidrug efflux system) [Methylobacterium aerolatum]GJD34541.1 Colistin resistance protein EmrA [Methylobacterium aerolatum]